MTARSLTEIVTGKRAAKPHVTRQPVRRNSYRAGEREHRHWRRFDRTEFNARMRAAELHDRDNKEPGKRNGPIGAIGLEVYRELMRMVCWKTGRLEPSIATICKRTARSRDAVSKAMARLKAEGFLNWIRRFEPVEDPDPFGPQVKQTTNAYWFDLPAKAAELVRRLMKRPTEKQRDAKRDAGVRDQAKDATAEHETAAEVATAIADPNSLLGRALRSAGLAWDRSNANPLSGENPALQG